MKSKCRDNQDTVCDWCLSENPVLNENFFQECNDYKKLVERFRKLWKDDLQEERVESDAKCEFKTIIAFDTVTYN